MPFLMLPRSRPARVDAVHCSGKTRKGNRWLRQALVEIAHAAASITDQPLYRYLIKVEVLERCRVGALLGSRRTVGGRK